MCLDEESEAQRDEMTPPRIHGPQLVELVFTTSCVSVRACDLFRTEKRGALGGGERETERKRSGGQCRASTSLLQWSQQLALEAPPLLRAPAASAAWIPTLWLPGDWTLRLLLGSGRKGCWGKVTHRLGEQRPREGHLGNITGRSMAEPGWGCHPELPGLERRSRSRETQAPGCVVASTWLSPPGYWGLRAQSILALSLPAVHSGSRGTSGA